MRVALWYLVPFVVLLGSTASYAERFEGSFGSVTTEGFVNLAGGYADGVDSTGRDTASAGFAEGRVLALTPLFGDVLVGPRITYRGTTGSEVDDEGRIGEASLIALGAWGRFELGDRRGLPDVLTGYAPNNYQFVSADYGPASGASLDPDGGLQTALLDGDLGRELNALGGLGITASLFADESTKLIYVAPKTRGFLAGVSYAPSVKDTNGRFRDLTQTGVTWEKYIGRNVYRLGGTYTYANGQGTDVGVRTEDLHSLSLGATATLDDALTLGVSVTRNGDTGLTTVVGDRFTSSAYGYAASANYNSGAWTFGGFVQRAQSEGDTARSGDDRLSAAQVGVSYRSSTHVRYFASVYVYELDDEGGAGAFGNVDDAVVLIGTRFSF